MAFLARLLWCASIQPLVFFFGLTNLIHSCTSTAYVMTALDLPHDEAFQYVQNRRFCVSPNLNFQRQIEAYESIHKASLAMAQYRIDDSIDDIRKGGEGFNRRKRPSSLDGDAEHEIDEEVRQRNLQAQKRRNDDGDEEARYYTSEMCVSL